MRFSICQAESHVEAVFHNQEGSQLPLYCCNFGQADNSSYMHVYNQCEPGLLYPQPAE